MMLWVGFSLAIVPLLVISRRNLALGMGIATIALALFTHSFGTFGRRSPIHLSGNEFGQKPNSSDL